MSRSIRELRGRFKAGETSAADVEAAAVMTMLQSCSPGLALVNIDNGFGAGATTALILRIIAETLRKTPTNMPWVVSYCSDRHAACDRPSSAYSSWDNCLCFFS